MLEGKQLFIFDFHKISSIHRILFHRTKQKTFLSARNKKEKKKRKRQNLDGTGTRPVRIFMERPCQRRSTIEKFNPQKLNEDPNNGRGPFLLPRNLADSFITRVSTKRVHVNGTGVIKRGGG